jgi:guanine deaminase
MLLRIGEDGKIAELAAGKEGGKSVIGGEGCWILPGFIDAHLHLPQWDRRGIDGLTSKQWEELYYGAEARLAKTDQAERAAEDFVSGMFAHGTTTAVSFGSTFAEATDKAFEVFARRGLRAVHGMVLNDINCPDAVKQDTDKALEQSRKLAAKWHGAENGRLSYAFSPRTPVTCSEKMLRGAAALSQMLRCYLQTNVAESLADETAIREAYPDSVDDVEVYAEMGMLTPRTILGHGVFLTRQQRDQVARAGTTLVHCPTANLFMENGMMDYVAHRSAGTKIALGSSIASGPDPFMPRVAIEAIQTAKALKVHAIPRRSYPVPTPAEAFWMLTRGAAEALSMGNRIGSLDVGFEADCLVIRPERWIEELPAEQQVSALLYTLAPDQIERVYVAGREVFAR